MGCSSVCSVTAFLFPFCLLHLENRMTVCMGYTAMTPQGRAGKRRQKGAGNPCRENGRTLMQKGRHLRPAMCADDDAGQ